MSKDLRKRGESIRAFLLTTIAGSAEPMTAASLGRLGAEQFGVTPRAISTHINILADQGSIELRQEGRRRVCGLKEQHAQSFSLRLDEERNQDEMAVYVDLVKPLLANVDCNAEHVLEYCFTEMFNNVIDHAGASVVAVEIRQTAVSTTILQGDDGIGIFKKIKDALCLPDERQSLLELSKGKFTTDPANHSGEGIFFSSRACDRFAISSNGLVFTYSSGKFADMDARDQVVSEPKGTFVEMTVNNHASTTLKSVFDRYVTVDAGFARTEIPVRLLQSKKEGLVTRSQAKRLLARIDRFKQVSLDFEGIQGIGQAFADQIFRVFANAHPDVTIVVMNASKDIHDAIATAKNNAVG